MTRYMKLVDGDAVRVCGDDSPAAKSVRTEEQLFALLSTRVSPEFLEAVLYDIDDFMRAPESAKPTRTLAWLSLPTQRNKEEPTE